MDEKEFIERLAGMTKEPPKECAVLALTQLSLAEIKQRTEKLLGQVAKVAGLQLNRNDWVRREDRTIIRLPHGGLAAVYHASGAMVVRSGLAPMELLFEKMEDPGVLTALVKTAAANLKMASWVRPQESLKFEKLWQIKAAAGDRQGKIAKPVLCRAIGAFRHWVSGIPVWGPASAVVKLAGGGTFDSVSIHVRPTAGETIDMVQVLPPEQCAGRVVAQLNGLFGKSKLRAADVMVPISFRFGYFSFPKRQAQPVLAPVYLAAVHQEGEETANYIVIVPASDKEYLTFGLMGSPPPLSEKRRIG